MSHQIKDSAFLSQIEKVNANTQMVINAGIDAGADAVKCVGSCGRHSRLVVEANDFTLADTISSQSLGVLVHKNQKKGSATTNATQADVLSKNVSDALSLASFSVADEYLTMAQPHEAPKAVQLEFLQDHALTQCDFDRLGKLMKDVLKRFRAEPKFALDRFEMSVGMSYQNLINSYGVNQSEAQTSIGWSFMGMAKDGEQVSGMDYDSGFSYDLASVEEKLHRDTDTIIKRTLGLLNPQKCPSYRGPILIAPRALSDLLLGTLLYHASARSVMDGKSRWADDVGTKVVSQLLSIRDVPHRAELSGATSYDGDGLPTRLQPIVEQGVLKTHLYDCYSAKKLGKSSNAFSGGPFGLEVAVGSTKESDLRAARHELLLITRFSGNVDGLTGDFSGLAKSSRLIRGGEDAGPVGETMIAGNIFELANQILALGDVLHNASGSYMAPLVLADGVTVS